LYKNFKRYKIKNHSDMFRIYAIHHQFRVSPVRLFLSVLSII